MFEILKNRFRICVLFFSSSVLDSSWLRQRYSILFQDCRSDDFSNGYLDGRVQPQIRITSWSDSDLGEIVAHIARDNSVAAERVGLRPIERAELLTSQYGQLDNQIRRQNGLIGRELT
jgi:hypothetical protein